MISKILSISQLVYSAINLIVLKLGSFLRRKNRSKEITDNKIKDAEINIIIKSKDIKALNKEFGWDPSAVKPAIAISDKTEERKSAATPTKKATKKASNNPKRTYNNKARAK